MLDTMMRQWLMLRMIPRLPRRIDAPTLCRMLAAQGVEVSLRTIQRDLASLATVFPLHSDSAKPQGWSWRKDSARFEIPGMDPQAALTFSLAEMHLQDMLPASVVAGMAPWFRAAHATMRAQGSALARWPEKLRVIGSGMPQRTTRVDRKVQETVYEGILNDRQIEVTYRAITTGEPPKTYPVHPLAIVVRAPVVYLACVVRDYAEPRFLALHRIARARLLDLPASRPAGFDVDRMIVRHLGIRVGAQPIKLRLRIRGVLRQYLAEAPITEDQMMLEGDAEWAELRATVEDTVTLRSWLRSLGPDAEVLAPGRLREEMRESLRRASTHYEG